MVERQGERRINPIFSKFAGGVLLLHGVSAILGPALERIRDENHTVQQAAPYMAQGVAEISAGAGIFFLTKRTPTPQETPKPTRPRRRR